MATPLVSQQPRSQERDGNRGHGNSSQPVAIDGVTDGQWTIVPATRIDSNLITAWEQLRARNPALGSGYFHPAFTRAVASVRDDVEIALLQEPRPADGSAGHHGSIAAIFPFQRVSSDVAQPVGGRFNDFGGVICADECPCLDTNAMVSAMRVRTFPYHAWIDQPQVDRQRIFTRLPSPWIDLSCGLDEYQQWARSHSLAIRKQGQKTRKLEREVGPLRFEFASASDEVFASMIRWKRDKFQRTRTFDLLSVEWTRNLLAAVREANEPGFGGLLSGLWSGNRLVAAHFGFICGPVLHYWFPAYDHEMAIYSPGTQLLLSTIEAAAANGVERIDLTFGDSPLKDRFANAADEVAAGCLAKNRLLGELAYRKWQFRESIRRTPFKETIKRVLRPVVPRWGAFEFR